MTDTQKPEWQCKREGCRRRRTSRPGGGRQKCCSRACNYVRSELIRLEALARAAGAHPEVAPVWIAAVEWNDALTRLQTASRRLTITMKTEESQRNDHTDHKHPPLQPRGL